jgi:nucleoside-diphosphate-sugar epimerase
MKILVTGGAGYIGSILVPELLAKGYTVTVLDNLLYKQTSLLEHCYNPKFEFIRGDARDVALLQTLIPKFAVLIPLAAIVGAPACDKDPLLATSVNLDAVAELNRIRSKNQWVLYPTTNSGYGVGEENAYCTEETPLRPISLYGRTKVQAEKLLLDSENVITFRLATVFGLSPRMRLDLMVNDFTYRALKDRFIVLFEENFKRNYLHIRDVASLFLFASENFEKMKNQPYNIGLSSANLSKRELCEKIKEHIPEFAIYSSSLGKDPDQRNYIVSNEKIERTGWVPKFNLDDGIQELIKGYRILNAASFTNL